MARTPQQDKMAAESVLAYARAAAKVGVWARLTLDTFDCTLVHDCDRPSYSARFTTEQAARKALLAAEHDNAVRQLLSDYPIR